MESSDIAILDKGTSLNFSHILLSFTFSGLGGIAYLKIETNRYIIIKEGLAI